MAKSNVVRLEFDDEDYATIRQAAAIVGRPIKNWSEALVVNAARVIVANFKSSPPPPSQEPTGGDS